MLRDVHLAIRRFWFKPLHTAMMVGIIGVGIGAATAVFSVVDQTILRDPPFAHADRLVEVMDLFRSANARSTNLTAEKIRGWRSQSGLFEAFEGYRSQLFDLAADQGEPERLRGLLVTTGLLQMLGVRPLMGRDFVEGDGQPGDPVVVISESFWRRRFGGQPQVLGAEIELSDRKYTVVGVMPRRFRLTGDDESLYVPVDVRAADGPRGFAGLGRLAVGVTPGSAQSIADTLAGRLQSEMPLAGEPFWDISVAPKTVSHVADTTRTALFVLLGAVGFVLLITCANTASLFLSQVSIRQRETAIRAAIGASRLSLFRALLVESVLLAGLGGALGILLSTWGVDAIVAAAPANLTFNATSPIEVDARILAIAGGITVLTGILFGLVPAYRGSTSHVEAILKSGADGSGRTGQGTFSSLLVVIEVAFSLVLLVGAALMVRTFINLHALEPGFDANGVVAVQVSLPTDKYVGETARSVFFDAVRERVRALPGVSEVAVAAGVFGGAGIYFGTIDEIEGRGTGAQDGRLSVPLNTITPDYFRALRIPILAGRTFTQADQGGSVIVSRGLADRVWPGGDAVGRRFRLDANHPWETVVGVAGNLEARAGEQRTGLHLYRPYVPASSATPPPRARGYAERSLIVRAGDPAAVVPAIRAAVWAVDANQPVGRVALVSDLYADSFARERFVLQLMTAFGAIAVMLTAAGIFGVLSQIVARRTREIGVRVALGARAADIVHLVLSRGVMLVAAGAVLGIAGALGLSRFLEALLFGVRPVDPLSFVAVTVLMVAVALAACWLPTLRAMRVDPASALRVD